MQKTLFTKLLKEATRLAVLTLDYIVTGTVILMPIVVINPGLLMGLSYVQFLALTIFTRASLEITTFVIRDAMLGK